MDIQHKLTLDNPPLDMVASPDGKFIFVLTNTGQIIALDFFVEIDTADSPTKGPRNAPVVLAVFSDFQ